MKPYYSSKGITIYHGDCREVLPGVCADVIVADPPYGVGKRYGESFKDDVPAFASAVQLIAGSGLPAVVFLPVSRLYDLPVRPQWTGVWSKTYSPSGLCAYPIYPHWDALAFYNIKGDFKGNKGHRSDVFNFAPIRSAKDGHPTPKPLDLMTELVRFMPNGTVLDPFMGSGTTLVAARNLKRKAVGIELEEKYCELAARRLEGAVVLANKAVA